MADVVELARNLELVNSYAQLGREYGLFTQKVSVPQPGAETKEYLVLSLTPIKDDINPVAIINRNKRNKNIFYPENFAIELHSENPLLMWEKISNYMAYAEFVYELYEQFDTPLPQAIRTDEVEALSNFYCNYNDKDFDIETRKGYLEGLRKFFENENTKSRFKKEWHKFYRSELFDADKSLVQNFFNFIRRNEPETSVDTLIESNGELKKVYMAEHHYKEFREIIKERYPDVKYSVTDKQISDKGILTDPETGKRVETPYGKTVTDEEYDKILEERFASEGFACLDGLTPSLFLGRDVMYKASDENIIASVSHEVSLRWAKCCDLKTLEKDGPVHSIDIPAGQIMNFYVGMKENKVPFFIDYNENSSPNFTTLRIVYNAVNENTVQNILIGLTMAQVKLAHISLNNQDIMFDINVQKVDALIQRARAKALTNPQSGINQLVGNETRDNNDVTF